MADHLNSVKTERAYHHGDLRHALLEAAEALIAERGIDHFSLRETARRAGVSAAAPAHHFGDARGLLTALAAEAFRAFADALEAADRGGTREERIRHQGRAYLRFALDNRGKFDLMWRYGLVDRENPAYRAESDRAFSILDRAVRGEQPPPPEPNDPSIAPSIACWAIAHGFARLALDGVFGPAPEDAERVAANLFPAVLDHLRV